MNSTNLFEKETRIEIAFHVEGECMAAMVLEVSSMLGTTDPLARHLISALMNEIATVNASNATDGEPDEQSITELDSLSELAWTTLKH